MTLKLSKLPKRTPVRISATFPPEIHAALIDYAHIYEQNYGVKEKIEDLVPYIIASFLDTDSLLQYEMSLKPGNVAEVDSNIK